MTDYLLIIALFVAIVAAFVALVFFGVPVAEWAWRRWGGR